MNMRAFLCILWQAAIATASWLQLGGMPAAVSVVVMWLCILCKVEDNCDYVLIIPSSTSFASTLTASL